MLIFLSTVDVFTFGLLYPESPRARVLALSIVTLSISVCLVVMLVNARPFVVVLAFQPEQLEMVLQRAESSMTMAATPK